MIRITLSYIYNVAEALAPLSNIKVEETEVSSLFVQCLVAENMVVELTSNTIYTPHLRASYEPAQKLIKELRNITGGDLDKKLNAYEVFNLKNSFDSYKTILLADLGILDCYFVSQKGAYDTRSLLMFGENLFPADLSSKVPEAIFDCREVGKCLAYENATAAGFHLFRVLESVLRRYYSHETDGKAQPRVRNIAVYVNAMQQAKKGDQKVLFLVKEISDRFRNPLIHPDVVLSIDDAIAILDLVRTSVTEMLKPLTIPAATTSTAVISGEGG